MGWTGGGLGTVRYSKRVGLEMQGAGDGASSMRTHHLGGLLATAADIERLIKPTATVLDTSLENKHPD